MTDKPPIRVYPLDPRTDEEIASEPVRCCDTCGAECLFGCEVAVWLGFSYAELCSECLKRLVIALTKLQSVTGKGEEKSA